MAENLIYTDELAEQFAKEAGVNPRPNETNSEIDDRGAFIRQPNTFLAPAGDGPGQWKPEAGRYAIYWATGCNWSNRPVIVRDLLGLQDVIADQQTCHSGQTNKYGHGFAAQGWRDPLTGAHFLSEFYKNAKPDFTGRATTPTLVDVIDKKAVNNDYHRMTNYLEVNFRPFQPVDAPDLYPKKFRQEIDQLNDWLFPHLNNTHYRMAFCQSPEAYEEAYNDHFETLEKLDRRLSENRFLFGDYITDSDVRAFVTLVRWDIFYYRNVGPLKGRVRDYPNLWGYVRELYAVPAFHKACELGRLLADSMEQGGVIGFFRPYYERILPKTDLESLWADDGKRRALSKTPDEIFLRHPAEETPEDYFSEISPCIWNSPDPADRDPLTSGPVLDAAANPLKGLL